MTTKLIEAQEIISLAFTNENSDIRLITDSIINAVQFTFIKPVLGEDYYDDLLGRVGTSDETDAEKTLIDDHLKPCLAYLVKHDVLDDLMVNTSSQGLRVNIDDNSQPASSKSVERLKQTTMKVAQRLMDKMVDYLVDNSDDFPDWTCSDDSTTNTIKRAGLMLTRNPNKRPRNVSNQSRNFLINDNLDLDG